MRIKLPPATLKGRIDWRLERAGVTIAAGNQPNLITNLGLDEFGLEGSTTLERLRLYCAVGEGSAAPAVTDVALGSEVQRQIRASTGAATGGDNGDGTYTMNRVTTYVFAITGAYNLTEIGFAQSSGTGMNIRELFRDGVGDPIVLTVQADDQLTIEHTMSLTGSPGAVAQAITGGYTIAEFDRLGAPVTTHDFASATMRCRNLNDESGSNPAQAGTIYIPGDILQRDVRAYAGTTELERADVPLTLEPYVAGSHTRRRTYEIPTSVLNRTMNRIDVRLLSGWLTIELGANFTKENTHTLDIIIDHSWARG